MEIKGYHFSPLPGTGTIQKRKREKPGEKSKMKTTARLHRIPGIITEHRVSFHQTDTGVLIETNGKRSETNFKKKIDWIRLVVT